MEILFTNFENLITEEQAIEKSSNKVVTDIKNKAKVIEENISKFVFIRDITENGRIIKKEQWQVTEPLSKVEVDMASATDEFILYDNKGEQINYIEVVTSTVARSNDMDFLDDEEMDEYELGGELSSYTQIGDTDYYYKEM